MIYKLRNDIPENHKIMSLCLFNSNENLVQLVEIFATAPSTTQTGHFNIFDRKFIIIRKFLAAMNATQREDNDVSSTIDQNLARVAIRITRMVDEASNVSATRRIDDIIVAVTEHITTDTLGLVPPLADVSH